MGEKIFLFPFAAI